MKRFVASLISASLVVGLMFACSVVRAADYILPETGDEAFRQDLHNVRWLRFAGGGKRVVSGSFKSVRLWDVAARRMLVERNFSTEPRLVYGDERTLILFEKDAGFLEFDPATLEPVAKDVAAPARKFLAAIHAAHPFDLSRVPIGSESKVREFWRGRGEALACTYSDGGFCFAPGPDPTTWVDIQCGSVEFAPDASLVVYSDATYERRRDENAALHIIGERFQPNGIRSDVFKFPYPKGYELGGLLIAADGSCVVCSWSTKPERFGSSRRQRTFIEAYQGDSGRPIGRIDLPTDVDHRLLDLRLDRAGKRLLVSRTDGNTLYDLGPSGFVERSRFALQLPYYGFRAVTDDTFARFAVYEHGSAFVVVDAAAAAAKGAGARLDAGQFDFAVHWRPWGMLGNETVVLRSTLGYKCARLRPDGAAPPTFRFAASDTVAVADDRSCVLGVSDKGHATLLRLDATPREGLPVRAVPHSVVSIGAAPLGKHHLAETRVSHLAVSSEGRRCAFAISDIVYVWERNEAGTYTEIHNFRIDGRLQVLKLSLDGRSLLTHVWGTESSRVAVHRQAGSTWKVVCTPWNGADDVGYGGFVGNELVFATKRSNPTDTRKAKLEFEVRRIADDTVLDTSNADYLGGVYVGQIGRSTVIPLVRDRRLVFREPETKRETPTAVTFAESDGPSFLLRDLGAIVYSRRDGRVAVRPIEAK